jgi:hypothetical protein
MPADTDEILWPKRLWNASAVYIFFGGKRTARIDVPSLVVHYYFSDQRRHL